MTALFEAMGNRCIYCGETHGLSEDHFVPITKGGEHALGNLVPACSHCNSKKIYKMPEEYLDKEELVRVRGIMEKAHRGMGL
jgi:5-methylcytosine-specific restriction endonuclease McrA